MPVWLYDLNPFERGRDAEGAERQQRRAVRPLAFVMDDSLGAGVYVDDRHGDAR
jgi:hypothetical protein